MAVRDWLLVRDVQVPAEPLALPEGIGAVSVRSQADPHWPTLRRFCEAHRFPESWPANMLSAGAVAHLLVADSGEAIGSGWEVERPFYVEEIGRTFDAGPGNCYFFGDLIAPAYRARGLHRHLIRLRLDSCRSAETNWAMAMTRSDNVPSVKAYQREGFQIAAELRTSRRRGWRLDSVHPTASGLPIGRLSREGFLLPGLGRIRRA
jgi:ribosomal protein S18 acetylase RimI-like enzyme